MIKYSNFRKLAINNVNEFLKLMSSRDSNTLSICAVILGEEISDEKTIIKFLKPLLKHVHAAVREGAINGLFCFYVDKKIPDDIISIVRQISLHDPSNLLKDCAKNLLAESGETNR